MDDEVSIAGSDYERNDRNRVQVSVELNARQAGRIDEQVPEATSGPEAIRMLIEQALQHREQQVTPQAIQRSTAAATAPIRDEMVEIKALLAEHHRRSD